MLYTWTVSLFLYVSNGGEKWHLKLLYKSPYHGKSGHIYNNILVENCAISGMLMHLKIVSIQYITSCVLWHTIKYILHLCSHLLFPLVANLSVVAMVYLIYMCLLPHREGYQENNIKMSMYSGTSSCNQYIWNIDWSCFTSYNKVLWISM